MSGVFSSYNTFKLSLVNVSEVTPGLAKDRRATGVRDTFSFPIDVGRPLEEVTKRDLKLFKCVAFAGSLICWLTE